LFCWGGGIWGGGFRQSLCKPLRGGRGLHRRLHAATACPATLHEARGASRNVDVKNICTYRNARRSRLPPACTLAPLPQYTEASRILQVSLSPCLPFFLDPSCWLTAVSETDPQSARRPSVCSEHGRELRYRVRPRPAESASGFERFALGS